MLVSVVIPCFNEEATISEFYRRLSATSALVEDKEFEFIFVNDGSDDKTDTILNDLADKKSHVKVLHLAQNRGHQVALTAGMDFAQGNVIVTIDADLQHPPETIQTLLAKIEEGFDIVHAQRKYRQGDTWFKRLSAKFYYHLMRRFSGIQLVENCGDFRAFTRPVLEAVKSFRMPHRFLRGIFVEIGFRQHVTSYESDSRFAGKSKYTFLKMLNLAVDGALGFSAAPIRIITLLSVLLWSISLVHLAKSLIEHLIFKITVPGWTSIVVLLFFFTGLILFSIAIIGSYVGRIFIQGQNIPLYWLCDARNIKIEQNEKQSMEIREVLISQRIIQVKNEKTP